MTTKYDKGIIDQYSRHVWFSYDYLGMLTGGKKIWYRYTGEQELMPSKYKIVNWWRKLTRTEKFKNKLEKSEVNPWTGQEEWYTQVTPFYNSETNTYKYEAPK